MFVSFVFAVFLYVVWCFAFSSFLNIVIFTLMCVSGFDCVFSLIFSVLHMSCHSYAAVSLSAFVSCTMLQQNDKDIETHTFKSTSASWNFCPVRKACLVVTPLPGGRSHIFISTHFRELLKKNKILFHPFAASLQHLYCSPSEYRKEDLGYIGYLMRIPLFHQLVKMSICIVSKCKANLIRPFPSAVPPSPW